MFYELYDAICRMFLGAAGQKSQLISMVRLDLDAERPFVSIRDLDCSLKQLAFDGRLPIWESEGSSRTVGKPKNPVFLAKLRIDF